MNEVDVGKSRVLEFRAAVLDLFLRISCVASVAIVPGYLVVGIDALSLACVAFAAFIVSTTVLFRRQTVTLATASRMFLGAVLLACFAGLWLGDEHIDNKPWQLLVPIAAFIVVGTREGWLWAGASFVGAGTIFVMRWPAYEPLAILVLAIAYATACGALYVFSRYNEHHIRTIAHLSHTDSLTGAYNRQLFEELASNLLAHTRRSGEALAVYMIDIDHFKLYNDRYGHVAGDHALAAVGQVIRGAAQRSSDLVFRYGGEEFCVVSSALDADVAHTLAESMVCGVRALNIIHEGAESGVLTVSVGLSHHVALSKETFKDVLQRADRALYDAKMRGRDRVELCVSGADRRRGLA